NTAVSVIKRMNGLELVVDECKTNQHREIRLGVDELFETAHQRIDLTGRWWDKRGILESRRRADVNLQCSIFASRRIAATDTAKEDPVQLANDARTDWDRLDPIESGFKSDHVVTHLSRVDDLRFATTKTIT